MADSAGSDIGEGLRRRYWAASLAGVPALAALGFALAAAGVRSGVLPTALTGALAVGWLWLANHLERRVASACCPRCGHLFHVRPAGAPRSLFERRGIYPRRCQHCGLALNGRDRGGPGPDASPQLGGAAGTGAFAAGRHSTRAAP